MTHENSLESDPEIDVRLSHSVSKTSTVYTKHMVHVFCRWCKVLLVYFDHIFYKSAPYDIFLNKLCFNIFDNSYKPH